MPDEPTNGEWIPAHLMRAYAAVARLYDAKRKPVTVHKLGRELSPGTRSPASPIYHRKYTRLCLLGLADASSMTGLVPRYRLVIIDSEGDRGE
jgi:hypothetical protein